MTPATTGLSTTATKKRQPGKSPKEQGRYQHPECRWKDVSCVRSLLTKKAHDQRRLEKAIRNTSSAAAAAAADRRGGGDGGGED